MPDLPIDPHKAVNWMMQHAPKFAAAKAQRMYIENFMRSKKALLMAESDAKAANEREQYALAHEDYQALTDGLKAAVEEEETLLWGLRAAQARIEIWRSQEASNRTQDKAFR